MEIHRVEAALIRTCGQKAGRTHRPTDRKRKIEKYGHDEDNRRFFVIILVRLKSRSILLFSPSNFRIADGHEEK